MNVPSMSFWTLKRAAPPLFNPPPMKRLLLPTLLLLVLLSQGCSKDGSSTGEEGNSYETPVDYADPEMADPTVPPSVEGPTTPPPADY